MSILSIPQGIITPMEKKDFHANMCDSIITLATSRSHNERCRLLLSHMQRSIVCVADYWGGMEVNLDLLGYEPVCSQYTREFAIGLHRGRVRELGRELTAAELDDLYPRENLDSDYRVYKALMEERGRRAKEHGIVLSIQDMFQKIRKHFDAGDTLTMRMLDGSGNVELVNHFKQEETELKVSTSQGTLSRIFPLSMRYNAFCEFRYVIAVSVWRAVAKSDGGSPPVTYH